MHSRSQLVTGFAAICVATLWLAMPASATAALNVDFGSSADEGGGPGGTQPGFAAFEGTENNGTAPEVRSFANSLGVGGTVDVTVSGYTHFRDYAGLAGVSPFFGQNNLLSDMVLRNSNGTMAVTVEDLEPGIYNIKTYHHSTQFGGGTIDLRLSDSAGLDQVVANNVPVTDTTNPASISTQAFQFITTGGAVDVKLLGGADQEHSSLNGFELQQRFPVEMLPVLAIDFNDRGATGPSNTQAGFDELVLTDSSGAAGSFGAIDVTLTHSDGGTLDDRRRTQPTNGGGFTQQELLRDFVFADGTGAADGLDVLVEGLDSSGIYEVTVWSFDDGSTSSTPRTSDWSVNGVLFEDNYGFSGSVDPTSNEDYSFSTLLVRPNAAGELLISGRAVGGGNPNVFLNALQVARLSVIPEPTTLLIWWLLAGLGMGLRWRRRK